MKNHIYQVSYKEKGAYKSKEYTSVESATKLFAELKKLHKQLLMAFTLIYIK